MMKTKGLRRNESARVATRRKATFERRTRLANEFRKQLRAELPNASAAQSSLIDSAVICHVQIHELGARYLQGRAGVEDVRRLSLARGQLSRVLRQLGLVTGPAELVEEQAGSALEELGFRSSIAPGSACSV
jgi:hypothetical protein